jgi:hypothetical protein
MKSDLEKSPSIRISLIWKVLLMLGDPTGELEAHLRTGRGQSLKSDVRSDAIQDLLRMTQGVLRDHKHNPYRRLPKWRLPELQLRWHQTGDPLFAWEALRFCAEAECEVPDWLMGYLVDCAKRMPPSDHAGGRDMRKILPSVLGFPAKRGPPKRLARPSDDVTHAEHILLVYVFAYAIGQGCSPSQPARVIFVRSAGRLQSCVRPFGAVVHDRWP